MLSSERFKSHTNLKVEQALEQKFKYLGKLPLSKNASSFQSLDRLESHLPSISIKDQDELDPKYNHSKLSVTKSMKEVNPGYIVSKILRTSSKKSPHKTLAFVQKSSLKAIPYDKIYNDLVCNNVHDKLKVENEPPIAQLMGNRKTVVQIDEYKNRQKSKKKMHSLQQSFKPHVI